MDLKPGTKLRSAVSDVQVVVVKAPGSPVDLACGGSPMLLDGEEAPAGAVIDPALDETLAMGKRYTDVTGNIELLCTRPGQGTLTVDGRQLELKSAKPLPASD